MSNNNGEKDRRFVLAIAWTILTAGVTGASLYLTYLGIFAVEQFLSAITPFIMLDGIFIRDYFKGKELTTDVT